MMGPYQESLPPNIHQPKLWSLVGVFTHMMGYLILQLWDYKWIDNPNRLLRGAHSEKLLKSTSRTMFYHEKPRFFCFFTLW